MADATNTLDQLEVASPCTQSWDAMTGDEKRRFCGECRLHVHNLSAMSRGEAEDLLGNAEGRVCVRFYRRPDGTVLTQDCLPVRVKLRRRLRRLRIAAAALFGFLGPLGLAACGDGGESVGRTAPEIAPAPGAEIVPAVDPTLVETMGEPLMGDVLVPAVDVPPEQTDDEAPGDDGTDESTPEQTEKVEDGSADEPRETLGRMLIR